MEFMRRTDKLRVRSILTDNITFASSDNWMSESSRKSPSSLLEQLHVEQLRVAAPPFSRAGHLWLVAHFGGYLATRPMRGREETTKRRAIVAAVRGYLDIAWERRNGMPFIAVIQELIPPDPQCAVAASLIVRCAELIEKSESRSVKPIPTRLLKQSLQTIESERDSTLVARWLRDATKAFELAAECVAQTGGADEATIETAADALVPTRYAVAWLNDIRRQPGVPLSDTPISPERSVNTLESSIGDKPADACRFVQHCIDTCDFSTDDLLGIHDAFSDCVLRLPSVDVNRAAEAIGVTVDRIHRMAATKEIDSFFIRRRIPKSEVSLKKKGARRTPGSATPKGTPHAAAKIVTCFRHTAFSIPELLEIETAFKKRIARASYSLSTAVERLGYSKVHVHLMLREDKLKSFSLCRLIPESEILRWQRDPRHPHRGRPRISE